MLEIIRERREEKKNLIKRAREFVEKAKKFGKLTAILYGSVARDEFNKWSDIDIVLISENLPKKLLKRQEILYGFKIPRIEPKGYRKEEFEEMLKIKHPFLKILKKEGIFLIDELGVEKKLRKI